MGKKYVLVNKIEELSPRGRKIYGLLNVKVFYMKNKQNKEIKKKDMADLIDKFLIKNNL